MFHDPQHYHDPYKFKPERFLGVDGRAPEQDPRALAFGFGRRICPGKDLADPSVFLSVAMTLAVFDISKFKDEQGNVVEPVYEYTPGIIRHDPTVSLPVICFVLISFVSVACSHPKPFKCSITPRSAKHADFIRALEKELPKDTSDADKLARAFADSS